MNFPYEEFRVFVRELKTKLVDEKNNEEVDLKEEILLETLTDDLLDKLGLENAEKLFDAELAKMNNNVENSDDVDTDVDELNFAVKELFKIERRYDRGGEDSETKKFEKFIEKEIASKKDKEEFLAKRYNYMKNDPNSIYHEKYELPGFLRKYWDNCRKIN
jgi:hypothetical protein